MVKAKLSLCDWDAIVLLWVIITWQQLLSRCRDNCDADDDSDDLHNDQWYETFSVNAEEKIYDDLCSVMSPKVD